MPLEKTLDFAFGYTNIKDDRSRFLGDIEDLSSRFTKTQVWEAARRDKSKWVSPDDYLEILGQAKYTMILPAYDAASFSIYRFIESIQT
jgi:hypothetical protein